MGRDVQHSAPNWGLGFCSSHTHPTPELLSVIPSNFFSITAHTSLVPLWKPLYNKVINEFSLTGDLSLSGASLQPHCTHSSTGTPITISHHDLSWKTFLLPKQRHHISPASPSKPFNPKRKKKPYKALSPKPILPPPSRFSSLFRLTNMSKHTKRKHEPQ